MPLNHPAILGTAALHVLALASLPYLVLCGLTATELIMHLALYVLGGLGITALYHRSWAHNAVQLSRAMEYALAVCATLVVQMPARQWIESHIEHHKHTDTDHDPYNINKGFWWAHCEWFLRDAHDSTGALPERLNRNPVVNWQERYYWPICGATNVLLPIAVGALVGTPWWACILLSALRVTLMGHVVYSVNSICHSWGTRPFSRSVSARDVWWFPFAMGEQYHNYHHAFPRDYRHGIRRFDFDPTKWFINALAVLGLARDLVAIADERIVYARQLARREASRKPE
jgi:stearoyl-CoA desaturase (delta-9 desaturase)